MALVDAIVGGLICSGLAVYAARATAVLIVCWNDPYMKQPTEFGQRVQRWTHKRWGWEW